ncbi:6-pyruvoyl-tetrahydropterin synthase [Rhizobium petrolearium]|uniref:6-pyruvoyl trahydropterin synthase family protein n=1 Tax=Neorhizobium petrolearium TaxID=515361 RepID=UPI001AE8B4F9|nr:6-carboxytetrahydropterin synthase [Neorhizobium petrolearium]MBP1847116.1 6-pyruvoyl-tetrahydropterin synthase [Neorhizobium petrolearium]
MFAIEVRDHIMVAHSLPRPVFGPAQGLHGATFTVDAAFFTDNLDENGLAVDIGLATDVLKEVLAPLNYQNLDTLDIFAGKVTTTEFLAKHIFDRIAEAIDNGRLGGGGQRVRKLRIILNESHTARGWYEAEL